MKTQSAFCIAAACLGLGLASGFAFASRDAVAQPAAAVSFAVMEYSVVPVTGKTIDASALSQADTLSTMSKQGWRFAHVSTQANGTFLFFERPIRR